MKKFYVPVLLSLVVVFLASCGGGTPEAVSIDLEMNEYGFVPEKLDFKVGQEVTLNLVNKGQLQHEVMFGRDVMKKDNRPAGYMEDMFEVGGVTPEFSQVGEPEAEHDEEMHEGFMMVLPIGGTGVIKFTVTKEMLGEWEMGCFEQEGVHYDAGMIGTVTITN
ncbi:MAG: hypothetical protein JSV42_14305 [Chloroflexota bacterium]|nr:MAG: hypothetical protein JSV42_14305 [Chloroflexota bacterium]